METVKCHNNTNKFKCVHLALNKNGEFARCQIYNKSYLKKRSGAGFPRHSSRIQSNEPNEMSTVFQFLVWVWL